MNIPLSENETGRQLFEKGSKALEAADFTEAIGAFQRALALFVNREACHEDRLRTLVNLGHALIACQEYESALASFNEALEAAHTLGDAAQKAWQMANIGSVYRDMERHDLSLPCYEEALTLFKELNHFEGVAAQYANLGYLESQRGNPMAAIEWFEQAEYAFSRLGRIEQKTLAERNIRLLRKRVLERGVFPGEHS